MRWSVIAVPHKNQGLGSIRDRSGLARNWLRIGHGHGLGPPYRHTPQKPGLGSVWDRLDRHIQKATSGIGPGSPYPIKTRSGIGPGSPYPTKTRSGIDPGSLGIGSGLARGHGPGSPHPTKTRSGIGLLGSIGSPHTPYILCKGYVRDRPGLVRDRRTS